MNLLKYIIATFLYCGILFPQMKIVDLEVIDLPQNLTSKDFQANKLSVTATGYYLLDSENRQIVFISNTDEMIFSGGYGIDGDAFIDPIEILSSRLLVWIIDRTENKVIEFDYKLNYLRTTEFEEIYPVFSGIDDWNNIYLYSDLEQQIYKSNIFRNKYEEYIDLTLWNDIDNCIVDFTVANDGEIGILGNCSRYLYIFNRLGKLEYKFPIENSFAQYLIKVNADWLMIDIYGNIATLRNNEKIELSLDEPILDVAQKDGFLYLLFSDIIWKMKIAVE